MKRNLVIYLSTLAILLPCDFLFLGTVGKRLFADNVGDMTLSNPRVVPTVAFYALYLAGIVVFVNGASPTNWASNLIYGALFGLFCYATFELTNMSVLKHWEWTVVVADIAWGATVTAVAAAGGGLLAGWLLKKF